MTARGSLGTMRSTWIAVAFIVFLVGAAVAIGIGRAGKPTRGPVTSEQPSAKLIQAEAPESAPIVSPPRRENAAPSSRSSIAETATRTEADAQAPAFADPPAILESRPLPPAPPAPIPGASLPPTTRPPTPEPARLPAAPQQHAGRNAETGTQVDDPESDRRPPVFQNLRFDPPEVKDGGTVVLTVSVSDDLSGIKFVFGSVRSPSGAAMLPFSARDLTGGGLFSATIVIPARGETGDWFVANLQIVDKAENPLTLSFARATVPEGGALRVVSDESDSTAPNVLRVTVAKGSVDAGEKNQIVVEVDDDRSGVAQVTGAFQSPTKVAFIPFTCTRDGESPTWGGIVPIPENADCGEWTLRQLRVVDKANNSSFLSMDAPQVGRVSFLVGGGGCDAEPPTLDALFFSPAYVSNAAAADLVVTVRAHDDVSGVASLSGWIDGPVATNGQAPRIHFEARPDPQDPDGPMSARITVPQFAARGVWRVTLAQVADRARNTRAYTRNDPALRDAAFTVE